VRLAGRHTITSQTSTTRRGRRRLSPALPAAPREPAARAVRSRASGSVGDGRLDELTEQVAVLAPPQTGRPLRHPHDHHLPLRIDPERGAGRATPAVLAGRPRHRVEARLLANGEAKPEPVAARQDGG